MTRLTDQLLALAREDGGAAPPARELVDLSGLVAAVADNMRPLAEAKGLTLHVDVSADVALRGDAGRLRQVFYNLLDNAIKYTPPGGAVEVRVEARPGAAVATVRDSGIGIPAEHLPHVFERFYRVDKARAGRKAGPAWA